jgi:hypothetical protein
MKKDDTPPSSSTSPPTASGGLDAKSWEAKIAEIGSKLTSPAKLTLMGSTPWMLNGQPRRMSIDLDVWNPTSSYSYEDLGRAVESCGLLFDPTGELEPDQPYVQIIEPGPCQLGKFHPLPLEKHGKLELEKPPAANLVASKLLRAHGKDLEDIAWIMEGKSEEAPSKEAIKAAIKSFPAEARETAMENLVYLDVLAKPAKKTPGKTEGTPEL